MSEVGKYLFRAANVWWRCTQFVFMSVVVTVWWRWECLFVNPHTQQTNRQDRPDLNLCFLIISPLTLIFT